MKAAREAWFEAQPDLEPERLIFIDETGLNTKMARLRGRCQRGERLRMAVPHGHWRTTTFVAGLMRRSLQTPKAIPPSESDGHASQLSRSCRRWQRARPPAVPHQ